MSAVTENILTGLPAGRAAVFLGEAGCGKSELAVHLALSLAGKGREVHFFDLDQTKPLMRSRDAQELLEGAGVTVHFERQTADAPTQVGGLVPLLLAPDKNVILDVGGGDAGARLIGGYSHLLKNADVWFIVNPYRPWSGSTEHIDGTLSAILRAARLLAQDAGVEPCAQMHLEKRVPVAAGLGGGSSDAACVLRTLNELEHGGLSRERLAELGGEIGSDVGFFIYGAASRCTGRGEKVEPLPEWKGWRPRVVLLKPSFGVSTPDAYRRWSGSRELPGIPYGEQDVGGHVLVNDLERPVFEKHLFLAEVKRWLMGRPGVRGAMMSGSGSTMFAVVEDEGTGRALMEDAARELDPTLWMWSGLVMQDDAR